ncbi:transmembrane 4 L6 family member 18 isoform X3 [Bos indicus x Bos taurus]|nr:transmembrane 4 L6 family member 18 isoform X3 [Bos indicus x Bos taurus]
MLVVAAVLLVLENDNNYKCCQSENCSKKYMFPYRFQRMDSVPGTRARSGMEHHLIFYSHSSQWTSSDCLPHQSGHSVVQESLWNLFSHHPAWNHLNKDKNVFLHQDMAIYLCLLNGLEGHFQMMFFSLQMVFAVLTGMPSFLLKFFSRLYVSGSSEMFIPF